MELYDKKLAIEYLPIFCSWYSGLGLVGEKVRGPHAETNGMSRMELALASRGRAVFLLYCRLYCSMERSGLFVEFLASSYIFF